MEQTAPILGLADGLVICLYLMVVMTVGIIAGRFTTTTHDFFLGGQRFAWWLVALSCIATLVGSYSFQQYSETAYKFGFCSMSPYTNEWFVLPVFLFGWLPIIYYSRVQSIPEYFERRFDFRTRMAVLAVLLLYLEAYIGINLLTIGLLMQQLCPLPMVELAGRLGIAPQHLGGLEPYTWGVLLWAMVMAVVSGIYMHAGGQNSVIATDMLQGMWLLIVGLVTVGLGIAYVGGPAALWAGLPETHRYPFAQFNRPPGLNAVGDFWGDGVVGTFAFYMINQGIMFRMLSSRSVSDARRAILVVVLMGMPLAAIAVSGIGWVGRALASYDRLPVSVAPVTPPTESAVAAESATAARSAASASTGSLPPESAGLASQAARDARTEARVAEGIFITVTRQLFRLPGAFGLVLSVVIAALLSTLDTYITATSALFVNDVWRPLRPDRPDREYLRLARLAAVAVTILGLGMIPLHSRFTSVYQTLSACTSFLNPPLVAVIVLAIAWRRFSARAAFWTLAFGLLAMLGSVFKPSLILPISHGDSPRDGFPYLRALFGLMVSFPLGLLIAWFDRPERAGRWGARAAFWTAIPGAMFSIYLLAPQLTVDAATGAATTSFTAPSAAEWLLAWGAALAIGLLIATLDQSPSAPVPEGLVLSTLDAVRRLRGRSARTAGDRWARLELEVSPAAGQGVQLPAEVMRDLAVDEGDPVYLSDARWWLGGYRSLHTVAGPPAKGSRLVASPSVVARGHLLSDRPVVVGKLD